MTTIPYHDATGGDHIDLPLTPVHTTGTIIQIEFMFTVDPTESMMLLEGRYVGNGWDQSNDRGFLEITSGCTLSNGYAGSSIKLNGNIYSNQVLSKNTKYLVEITTNNAVSQFVSRIGSRFAENAGTWNPFKGYIYSFKISGSGIAKNTIEYKFTSIGKTFPNSGVLENVSEVVYEEDALVFTNAGAWTVDTVNKSAVKTSTGWSRLYLTNVNWPPPLYRVKFNVTNLGTGITRLYYNCRNNIQHGIDISLGMNEFYIDIAKDGRAYLDSINSGCAIDNVEVSFVNAGTIHTENLSSVWDVTPVTDL